MIGRFALMLLLVGSPAAQVQSPLRVRVSSGVTNALADRKVLPDIGDLKGQKLDSLVVVIVEISTAGDVQHSRARQGDPDLFRRSEEAAQKWHFKPYMLNGQSVGVETTIAFRYKKNKVTVEVPR